MALISSFFMLNKKDYSSLELYDKVSYQCRKPFVAHKHFSVAFDHNRFKIIYREW